MKSSTGGARGGEEHFADQAAALGGVPLPRGAPVLQGFTIGFVGSAAPHHAIAAFFGETGVLGWGGKLKRQQEVAVGFSVGAGAPGHEGGTLEDERGLLGLEGQRQRDGGLAREAQGLAVVVSDQLHLLVQVGSLPRHKPTRELAV